MLLESNEETVNYTEPYRNNCIVNIDVAQWCWEQKSNHVHDSVFGQYQCPVCLDAILHDSIVLKLGCDHVLHFECANRWFLTCVKSAKSAKCPLCNFIVLCPVFEVAVPVQQTNSLNNETMFSRIIRYICGS